MKQGTKSLIKTFSIEFVIYGALVGSYFFLVLHFWGNWLNELFQQERKVYAFVALILIVAQGLALEVLTRVLVRVIGKNKAP